MTRTVSGARRGVPGGAHLPLPYDEQPPWSELWEACVVVLDRYPRLRRPPAASHPVVQQVTIPKSAADAADMHFHLD